MTRLLRIPCFAAVCVALCLGGCDTKMMRGDTTPPTAAITSPSAGQLVSGVGILVEVAAADEVGVDRVEVVVADRAPIVLDGPPFRGHVATLGIAAGTTAIRAEAFDAAGNSVERTVLVDVAATTVTKLTSDPQDDLNPAWSPDGMRLAFQSDRGSGEFNIWAMDAGGGNLAQLTADVNEDRNPAWSPDGAWIAFDSDRAGTFDIWRMPVVGGEAMGENLTFGNRDDIEPAWSPGGTDIWFASDRGDDLYFNVWRQSVATGVPVQVTSFANDDRAPALSMEGLFAFSSTLNLGTPHAYTRAAGTSEVAPLTGDPGITEIDPAWSPGGVVVFTRSAGLHGNLWFKPVDPAVPAMQATFGTGTVGDGGAAWHPDGDRIAFHSDRDGNLDVWLIE